MRGASNGDHFMTTDHWPRGQSGVKSLFSNGNPYFLFQIMIPDKKINTFCLKHFSNRAQIWATNGPQNIQKPFLSLQSISRRIRMMFKKFQTKVKGFWQGQTMVTIWPLTTWSLMGQITFFKETPTFYSRLWF